MAFEKGKLSKMSFTHFLCAHLKHRGLEAEGMYNIWRFVVAGIYHLLQRKL